MNSNDLDQKLIQDDSIEVESTPAPSHWGRIAIAATGAAVVLSRLAGVAHADDGDDDDAYFMHASHKDGAAHDDGTIDTVKSPKSVKTAKTVKTAGTMATAGTANTANTGDTIKTAGTANTGDTVQTPGTVDTVDTMQSVDTYRSELVSLFAEDKLSSAQEAALAALLPGVNLDKLSVSEFVHALKAAGLTNNQILSVLNAKSS